jgi:hypothetical protein
MTQNVAALALRRDAVIRSRHFLLTKDTKVDDLFAVFNTKIVSLSKHILEYLKICLDLYRRKYHH